MARGRPPKPSALKVFEGNPGKRDLNQNEPQPKKGTPSCPKNLTGEALAEWDRVTPELERIGLLTIVDRATLVSFCLAWKDFFWAVGVLDREGRIIKGGRDNHHMVHPADKIRSRAAKGIQEFGNLLGLNPSARSRLHVAPQGKESKTKFGGLLA